MEYSTDGRSRSRLGIEFSKLQNFLKPGNPCSLTNISEVDETVGTWVAHQRKRNHKGMLRADRKKRLESINFDFGESRSPRPQRIGSAQRGKWEGMFQRLLEFKQKHGHASVPYQYEDRSLALRVTVQRRNYHQKSWYGCSASIRDDRRNRLEEIGFVWDNSRKKQNSRSAGSHKLKSDCGSTREKHLPSVEDGSRRKKISFPADEAHRPDNKEPSISEKKRASEPDVDSGVNQPPFDVVEV